MINERELQTLVEFTSDAPPVLSLYLNVDPIRRSKDEYRLILRNLLKEVSDRSSDKDRQAIEHYFDFQYDGLARGVVIFSCQEHGLWETFILAVPVFDRAVAARRPYVTPLQDLLNTYGRYGVILVDKEGGRFFLFDLGQLQEAEGTLGDELKRHKQGGRAAQRLQRKVDGTAHQNLKSAAQLAHVFCQEKNCSHIILGGTGETLSEFRSLLPKAMQERVVGQMAMDMWSSEVEVRDKTIDIIHAYSRQEEQELVERMITSASKGEAGVIGLADTLNALQQEQVHILLIAEGFEEAGARCTNCGFLAAQPLPLETCTYCGSPMRPSEHVVDSAVRLAIERGVAVKIVSENPALQQAGGIGAILRY